MSRNELSPAAKYMLAVRESGGSVGLPPELHLDLTRGTIANNPIAFDIGTVFRREEGLYERLRKKLKSISVEGQPLYVVEGDTLLDEAQLQIYAMQKEASNHAKSLEKVSDLAGLGRISLSGEQERGLLGITQEGRVVRWKPGMVLSYCVLKSTFPDLEKYELVKGNFRDATEAWVNTCGIEFRHEEQHDDSDQTDATAIGVVFVVRYIDANGAFIAAAFFPNDPVYRRNVLIDPSYFQSDYFDPVGVLRHEIGHILGFRHEHIRSDAPAICNDEDIDNTTPLTVYDSRSVMHYLCGGHGDPGLKITALDVVGAQRVYGPPVGISAYVS